MKKKMRKRRNERDKERGYSESERNRERGYGKKNRQQYLTKQQHSRRNLHQKNKNLAILPSLTVQKKRTKPRHTVNPGRIAQ